MFWSFFFYVCALIYSYALNFILYCVRVFLFQILFSSYSCSSAGTDHINICIFISFLTSRYWKKKPNINPSKNGSKHQASIIRLNTEIMRWYDTLKLRRWCCTYSNVQSLAIVKFMECFQLYTSRLMSVLGSASNAIFLMNCELCNQHMHINLHSLLPCFIYLVLIAFCFSFLDSLVAFKQTSIPE